MQIVTPLAEPGSTRVESAYLRSFNRYEFKYIVAHEAGLAFAADLALHARPDPHSGTTGYDVYSLYLDSPELRCFWEKLDGQKYRRKLRFRRYGASGEVFVEIKQRTDRTVQKRRHRLPAAELPLVFAPAHEGAPATAGLDPVLQEALVLRSEQRLVPKVAVRYRRAAWFATFEADLRVTFDTALRYDAGALDLERPFAQGKWLLDPALSVVEIKYNHRVPLWLVALVQKHGLSVVRFSKYCAAVDLVDFDGRHGLTPRIR